MAPVGFRSVQAVPLAVFRPVIRACVCGLAVKARIARFLQIADLCGGNPQNTACFSQMIHLNFKTKSPTLTQAGLVV
nr:MAG TPA: hypothetical protein [Caudoviricetes sp.]